MRQTIFTLLLLMPSTALALNDDYGINDFVNGNVNLGTRDPRAGTIAIVNILLGFLGILATIGILYGGFKMMTAGGNAEETGKGRQAIAAGLIGLIIVLAAYAISRFVLESLQNEIR